MAGEDGEGSGKLLMCGAVGSRGRRRRRQGTHCEGYYNAMLSARLTALSPASGNGHTHEAQATRNAVSE